MGRPHCVARYQVARGVGAASRRSTWRAAALLLARRRQIGVARCGAGSTWRAAAPVGVARCRAGRRWRVAAQIGLVLCPTVVDSKRER